MADKLTRLRLIQYSGRNDLTLVLLQEEQVANAPGTALVPDDNGWFVATVTAELTAGIYDVCVYQAADLVADGGKVYYPGDVAGEYTVDDPRLGLMAYGAVNSMELMSVSDRLNTVDDKISTLLGNSNSGEKITIDIDANYSNGAGIPRVTCWLTMDAAGNTPATDEVYTNANGVASFPVLPGRRYYLWRSKLGVEFDNPKVIDVPALPD